MSKQLLVKHWAGWITPENIETPGWLEGWKERAQNAADAGNELLVFEVPKGMASEIERFLQDWIKK